VLHHFGVGTVMQGLRGESGQGEKRRIKGERKGDRDQSSEHL
jgi:hypothetical protein